MEKGIKVKKDKKNICPEQFSYDLGFKVGVLRVKTEMFNILQDSLEDYKGIKYGKLIFLALSKKLKEIE